MEELGFRNIISFSNGARDCVLLSLNGGVNDMMLTALIQLSQRGVSVELILTEHHLKTLHNEPFLLNRLIQLINKGGDVYTANQQLNDSRALCIRDYKGALVEVEGESGERQVKDPVEIRGLLSKFNSLKETGKPYLSNADDVNIIFKVSEEVILQGDEVTISWEVSNAEKVVIQGLGSVDAIGQTRIKPESTTILKIGAYNQKQSKLKTLPIKVYSDIHIDYDLSFLNTKTKRFISLVKASNHPHIFGMARGNKVKFSWNVKETEDVHIHPFGLEGATGQHTFLPQERVGIDINVRVLDRVITRKIKLLLFPVAVFKDKILKMPLTQTRQHVALKLKSGKISSQIRATRDSCDASFTQLKNDAMKSYISLNREVKAIMLKSTNPESHLKKLNRSVFDGLIRKNSKKPKMVKFLASLKSHYER